MCASCRVSRKKWGLFQAYEKFPEKIKKFIPEVKKIPESVVLAPGMRAGAARLKA